MQNMFKRSFLFMALLLFGMFLTGCMASEDKKDTNDKQTTGNEDLEEKVVVYSPHGKDILSDFQKQFEEEYGIKMEFLDMGSQEILDRVRSEKNNPQADVWWGAPQVNFDQAKEEGLLQEYKPSYADALDEMYYDPDWMWTGTSITPEVILYNSKELSEDEVPKDWDDLLDPKWKDDIIIRYPLASGTMRTIYSAMIYRTYKDTEDPSEGYEWLKKLDDNTKEYSANPEIMYNDIAKGVGKLTVWNMPDTVMLAEEKDYPFDYVIPESGTPVLTEGIAIIKDAPHPKAAEAFYEFVNTPEAMQLLAEKYYRIPTRTDVENLPDWITETEIKPMDIDWALFQEKSDEWMDYWDNHIKNASKDKSE
ncbi:iron(III) transport system substrate-binding protein [Cerasibacillus quisquiliarum]|uniref:Iron ABC transporter substrate-binding protein n=1 Tax=Cerasibacillus quisquiliarum TaxID=227865 RepID=A0A511UYL8_9BACI|nr:extracellular solute-binding protein [Cerasibacillus quisquiliarum]MBB5146126.1 iron(III) transport system substrate-binding protein [Cerasibacillus quisquiliarum]GEN30861.1 iron ABC transporter substrate-binding protein [Cerasibacillus quisquiliarum]